MKKFWLLLLILPLMLSAELTLEEKVGQLLLVHFNGEEVNSDAKRLIEEAHVGGFIYYNWANNLSDPNQVKKLSQSLQNLSKIPLFIAVDQEGGRITRLQNGFSKPPANGWIGLQGHPKKAEEWAALVGAELKAVGVNLNLAPVVDVNSNPQNPVIGDRSFSAEPWEVVRFGAAALKGYHAAGVLTVLKHFPGHGDTTVDSHAVLPIITKTREQLDQVELLPFKRLTSQAPMIMTSHILLPSLDSESLTTFSHKIVTGLLREEFGYEGVIITDSLVMQALLNQTTSVEEAAIRSLLAGHDMIILGGKQLLTHQQGLELTVDQIINIHHMIVSAVRQGRLAEETIDKSLARIMHLKKSKIFSK